MPAARRFGRVSIESTSAAVLYGVGTCGCRRAARRSGRRCGGPRRRRLATVILSTTNLFVSFRWQQNEQLAQCGLAIAVVFTTMRGCTSGRIEGETRRTRVAKLDSQAVSQQALLNEIKQRVVQVEALSQSLSSEKTVRSQLEMVNSILTARVGQSRKEPRHRPVS